MPKLIPWIFFIALFLIFLLPPTDPDLGWQLRCGELFWRERSFCEQNQFTVLLPNYSWPNHGWGYQALIYPIYKFFGLWGLTIFNALLMTAAFYFLYAATRNHTFEKMLGILATIYFGWGVFSFGLRSQLVGFFFFNLTLWLLTKIGEKPKLVFLLPLTMLVWANTHGSAILGLILLGCSILPTIVGNLDKPHILKNLMPLSLTSAGATLINPFGFRIYEEMWRHFAGPIDLSKLIAEWVPPVPLVQKIILLTGGVVFLYILLKFFTASPPLILYSLFLIPIFAFLALQARRHVPFFFAVTSFTLLNALPSKKASPTKNQLAALSAGGVLLYGLLVQLPQTIETNSSWQNFCRNQTLEYPCAAVEFLKTQGPPSGEASNTFNRYEWGGFLIWQLPEHKIFVDGRMPAWPTESGKSPYTIYLETLQTQPDWQETLDQYNINYILISPGTFMDLLLEPDPQKFGWQEIYRDKIAVVYKRG